LLAVAGVGILRAVLLAAEDKAGHDSAQAIVGDLRRRLANSVLTADRAWREQHASGSIATAAVEQCDALMPFLARAPATRIHMMVAPLAILLLAFSINWLVGALLLIAAPLLIIFMALLGARAGEAGRRQMTV